MARLSRSLAGNPGSQYVSLQPIQGLNNGTVPGGLAFALQSGMQGLMAGRRERAIEADRQQQLAARKAQMAAVLAAGAPPDPRAVHTPAQLSGLAEAEAAGFTGAQQAPAPAGTAPGAPRPGTFHGRLAAELAKSDNPYLAEPAMQAMMQDAELRQRQADIDRKQAEDRALYVFKQKNKVPGEGTADPSAVREWQFFNSLSDEEKRAYLIMKRAAPRPYDVGSDLLPVDPRTGAPGGESIPVGAPPKTVVDQTTGRVVTVPAVPGGADAPPAGGEPQVSQLPPTVDEVQEARVFMDNAAKLARNVRNVVNHPGMPKAVGMPQGVAGWVKKITGLTLPGSDVAGFAARMEQIGGDAFLQAFERLKGGGHITEIEGDKATAAVTRMVDTNQSEAEFIEAAKEFLEVIESGVRKASKRYGIPYNQGGIGVDFPKQSDVGDQLTPEQAQELETLRELKRQGKF